MLADAQATLARRVSEEESALIHPNTSHLKTLRPSGDASSPEIVCVRRNVDRDRLCKRILVRRLGNATSAWFPSTSHSGFNRSLLRLRATSDWSTSNGTMAVAGRKTWLGFTHSDTQSPTSTRKIPRR